MKSKSCSNERQRALPLLMTSPEVNRNPTGQNVKVMLIRYELYLCAHYLSTVLKRYDYASHLLVRNYPIPVSTASYLFAYLRADNTTTLIC